MTSCEIVLEPNPMDADIHTLKHSLVKINNQHAEPENWQALVLYIRDAAGGIVGGLLRYTRWRWLYVENLWAGESLRGLGYRQQLMRAAEQEARARDCHHAFLDTFSFQARGFHQKLGYETFGQLDDYPPGRVKYFLQKRRLEE